MSHRKERQEKPREKMMRKSHNNQEHASNLLTELAMTWKEGQCGRTAEAKAPDEVNERDESDSEEDEEGQIGRRGIEIEEEAGKSEKGDSAAAAGGAREGGAGEELGEGTGVEQGDGEGEGLGGGGRNTRGV